MTSSIPTNPTDAEAVVVGATKARAPAPSSRHDVLSHFAFGASLTSLAISVIVLVAWQTHSMIYASVAADYVPMTMFVAICVLLLSISLFALVHLRGTRAATLFCILVASLVLVMSVWALLDPVLQTGFGIEEFLSHSTATTGGYRIADTSPISAVTLLMGGIVILISQCQCKDRHSARVLASFLSLGMFSVGLVTVLGYLYGSPLLYGGEVRPVSLLSGAAFALLGVALIAVRGPGEWPTSSFVGPSVESRLTRFFVPLMVFVVLMSASLSSRALSTSSNPALTVSLLALLTALVVGYVIRRLTNRIGRQIDETEARRAKAEEELRQANQKLNVLNSITRHDALNQLAVILGRLGLAKSQCKDPSVARQVDESLRSAETIEKMLQFSGEYQKLGVSGPVWIDVDKAFKAVTTDQSASGLEARSEVAGVEVLADVMFEKVLSNFVDNSVRHGERVKSVRLSHIISPEGLVLAYEDDGVGLSSEAKANLFRPGFGKHTGFGMYLSKEILEFSGLSIKETGTYGRGARFEISVPKGKYRLSRTDI